MAHRWLCNTLFLVGLSTVATAQSGWVVRGYGGLGIGVGSMPALADYANVVGGPSRDERVEDFQTMFELNAGIEISITREWSLGFDYVSASRTIQTSPENPGSSWEFVPSLHMPTIVARRLYEGERLTYGFGVGAGYHTGRLVQRFLGSGAEDSFVGSGPGFLLQGVAYTFFDENFSGLIALDLRGSFTGTLRDATGRSPVYAGATASLETFAVTLRFGLAYQK